MVPRDFTFDSVFDPSADQAAVFAPLRGMVQSVLAGYNATVLAFGPSGAGKTHTIMGSAAGHAAGECSPVTQSGMATTQWGVLQRALAALFAEAEQRPGTQLKLTFVELYNNKFKDLLADPATPSNVLLRDTPSKGVFLTGSATLDVPVATVDEALAAIQRGNANRAEGVTDLNSHSSRSHALVQVTVSSPAPPTASPPGTLKATPRPTRVGKLIIADLAGSERLAGAAATMDAKQMAETQAINLSLTALTDVLTALATKSKDSWLVPYRNSKLTHFLRGAVGGAARTVLLAHAAAAPAQYRPTLLSLQYASRCCGINAAPVARLDFAAEGTVPARELETAKCALDATQMDLAASRDMAAEAQANVARLEAELAALRQDRQERDAALLAAAASPQVPDAGPAGVEAGTSPIPLTPQSALAPSGVALQTSPALLEAAVTAALQPALAEALLQEKATLEASLADKFDAVEQERVAAAAQAAREAEHAQWAAQAAQLRAELTSRVPAAEVEASLQAARSKWEDEDLPAAVEAAVAAAVEVVEGEVVAEYRSKLDEWKTKAKEAVAAAKVKISAARAEAKAATGGAAAAQAEVAKLTAQLKGLSDPLAAPTPRKGAGSKAKGKAGVQLRAAVTRLRAERSRRKELEAALAGARASATAAESRVTAQEEELAEVTTQLTQAMTAALDQRDRELALLRADVAEAQCEAMTWRLAAHKAQGAAVAAAGARIVTEGQLEAVQAELSQVASSRDALANFTVALVRDLQDALVELETAKDKAAAAEAAAVQAETAKAIALRTAESRAAEQHTAAAVAAAERDAQWKGMSQALQAMGGAAARQASRPRGSSGASSFDPSLYAAGSDTDGSGMPFPFTEEDSTAPRRARKRKPAPKRSRAQAAAAKAAAARSRPGTASDSSYHPGASPAGESPAPAVLDAFADESPSTLAVMSRVARRSIAWAAEGRRSLDGASLPQDSATGSTASASTTQPSAEKLLAELREAEAAAKAEARKKEAAAKKAAAAAKKEEAAARKKEAAAAKRREAAAAKAEAKRLKDEAKKKEVAAKKKEAADEAEEVESSAAGRGQKRGRGAKALQPVPTNAETAAKGSKDTFAPPSSTESGGGGLFSAADLDGMGSKAQSKKRRLLGKGAESSLATAEPSHAKTVSTDFRMGMGAFGRSGGFALPRLKAGKAAR